MTMLFNSSPQRVEHNSISTKLYSHNLVSVVIRVSESVIALPRKSSSTDT